jgi:membrane fusion protein (multidrug efflux system)
MADEQTPDTPPAREGPGPDGRKGPGAHLTRIGVILAILLGVGGVAIFWQRYEAAPEPETAPAPAEAMAVRMETVVPESVPLVPRYLGRTEASQTVEIRARVPGFLEARGFEEGATVREGDVLFVIDPRQYQTDLDIARAELASAEARADRAARQVERFEELVRQQAGTTSELDEWQTEVRVAQAQRQLAEARIAQAELNLDFARITSPIDGVIGEAERDVGSFVGPQDGGLLGVVERTDPIRVRFSVSEADILRWQQQVESGEVESPSVDEMRIRIELADGRVFPHLGRISFLGVRIDPSTGSSVVLGEAPNPGSELLPGQFCYVSILGVTQHHQILVPQRAVIQNPTGSYVYIADADDTARLRPVELGDWVGERITVRSGLEAGDRVITDRLMMLRPGAPVTEAASDGPGAPAPAGPGPGVEAGGG